MVGEHFPVTCTYSTNSRRLHTMRLMEGRNSFVEKASRTLTASLVAHANLRDITCEVIDVKTNMVVGMIKAFVGKLIDSYI